MQINAKNVFLSCLWMTVVAGASAGGVVAYRHSHRQVLRATVATVERPDAASVQIEDASVLVEYDAPAILQADAPDPVVVAPSPPIVSPSPPRHEPVRHSVPRMPNDEQMRLRQAHAVIAIQQRARLRHATQAQPDNAQAQILVATAMRNAIASRNPIAIEILKHDINWLAGLPGDFRNPAAFAEAATLFPDWVQAHRSNRRPSDRWVQWVSQHLQQE